MTLSEKQAWGALAAGTLVFAYVCANTFEGWAIPDQSARSLWRTWLFAIGAAIVLDLALTAWAQRERARGALTDERDETILRRADSIGFGAMVAGVQVVMWQFLWGRSVDAHPLIPRFDPTHAPTLFLMLFAIVWVGYFARQAAVIVLGRL